MLVVSFAVGFSTFMVMYILYIATQVGTQAPSSPSPPPLRAPAEPWSGVFPCFRPRISAGPVLPVRPVWGLPRQRRGAPHVRRSDAPSSPTFARARLAPPRAHGRMRSARLPAQPRPLTPAHLPSIHH